MKIPEKNRIIDSEIGMQLVQRGGFAYHIYPVRGYVFIDKYFSNQEICELMEVHLGQPQINMFTTSRNCTFDELIRVGSDPFIFVLKLSFQNLSPNIYDEFRFLCRLTKISEVGLRKRQVARWHYKKPQCRNDILSAPSINIHEFASHLIILAVGMAVSIIIFLTEIVHSKNSIELERNGLDNNRLRYQY